jgi:putative RNA 2'-phosphotransferase
MNSNIDLKRISKFMSLVLRHKPEEIGLSLNENGWASVEELIQKMNTTTSNVNITKAIIQEVVSTNDKKRFTFNEDETMIRANQGHSIDVELALQPSIPPEILYHGTVEKFLPNIKVEGLQKMSRQHVHLSENLDTATKVGSRRGKPIILTVQAKKMHDDGLLFYRSVNNVWLTDNVPGNYINFEL